MIYLIVWFATFLACMPLGSFVIDPFLLLWFGTLNVLVTVRVLYKKTKFRGWISVFSILTMANFYLVSVSLYFNLQWVDWLRVICIYLSPVHPPDNGYDWMINSGLFNFPWRNPSEAPPHVQLLSGFLFAFYPFWLYLGTRLGYILYGKNEHQTGLVGILW